MVGFLEGGGYGLSLHGHNVKEMRVMLVKD